MSDLFYSQRFSCYDCDIFITDRSAYHHDGEARCWPCHCRAIDVWDEFRECPTVELDEKGQPLDEVSVTQEEEP